MAIWTFMDYVSPAGNNQITSWSEDTLSIQGQSDLNELLRVLSKTEVWVYPDFKSLSGNLKGFGEIRWKEGGKQMRLIGVAGVTKQYILLIGCSHKGRVYDPPDALDTALTRKKTLDKKTGSICEH